MRIRDIKFDEEILKNGIRVIIAPLKNSPSVSIGVFINVGSTYETKDKNGISHLLEHLCFKGTKKRPDQISISSEFEEIGASYNAFTDRDFTGYYAKVAFPYFEKALDIISDIYLNSQIKKDGFEEEKKVVVEEINMYEDNPRSKVFDKFEKLLYGDSPIGRNIAGTKENVLSFTTSDVRKFKNKHYTGKNTYVIISGNIDTNKTKTLVKKIFSQAKSGSPNMANHIFPEKLPERKVEIIDKNLDQVHIVMGSNSYPYANDRNYSASIMSAILGGTMSSRLFQEVRGKLGAAYYIYSSNYLYATHGFFAISAGLSKERFKAALKSIEKQLVEMQKYGPTKYEMEKAKKNIIGHLMLARETSNQILFGIGDNIIKRGNIIQLKKMRAKIDRVSNNDVKSVAKDLLDKSKLKISIIGKHKNTKDISKILF